MKSYDVCNYMYVYAMYLNNGKKVFIKLPSNLWLQDFKLLFYKLYFQYS